MLRVYISHPLSGDIEGNRAKVDAICKALIAQGEVLPISPVHLFGYAEDDRHREEIIEVDLALIDLCDEVWFYGISEGCCREFDYATEKGIKTAIPWLKEINHNDMAR